MKKQKYKLYIKEAKHKKLPSIIRKDLKFYDYIRDNTCVVLITKSELTDVDKNCIIGILKAKNINKYNLRICFQTYQTKTENYNKIIKNSYKLENENFLTH